MSDLVGNPEYRFCRVAAHIITVTSHTVIRCDEDALFIPWAICLTKGPASLFVVFWGIVEMKTNVTLKLLLECLFLITDKC